MMGELRSIKVDEKLAAFVEKQVENGRYGSASEVIEDALRLMQESDAASLEAIRAAIQEGEDSGEPQPFDFDEFIEQKRARRLQP